MIMSTECFSVPQALHLQLYIHYTVARQSPLSMGFSWQEYWNGQLCPPPGDLPDPGIAPSFDSRRFFTLSHWGSPVLCHFPSIACNHHTHPWEVATGTFLCLCSQTFLATCICVCVCVCVCVFNIYVTVEILVLAVFSPSMSVFLTVVPID